MLNNLIAVKMHKSTMKIKFQTNIEKNVPSNFLKKMYFVQNF